MKKSLVVFLSLFMLCGGLVGCGKQDAEKNEVTKEEETVNVFEEYTEYYNKFCKEHKGYNVYGDTQGINTDNYKMYDGAAKIVLEGSAPLLLLSDLISVNLDNTTWVYDVYFFEFNGEKVKEKTVVKNITTYSEGFLAKSTGDNVYLYTASGMYKITEDSYELVMYDECDFSNTLNSVSHRQGDFYYYSANFVDYVMEVRGSCNVNQKINCLSGKDFTDYLAFLKDKSFKNVCELDDLHRDYLVKNRYCDDFNLWYEYKKIPLVYYSPDEDQFFFNLFMRSNSFKKENFNWDKSMLIPCIHEMTTGQENTNYKNFNDYEQYSTIQGKLNYINDCLAVELPTKINGVSVLKEYFSNELGVMKRDLEKQLYLNAYAGIMAQLGEYSSSYHVMVHASDSDIPYLLRLSDSGIIFYHYENGSVVERNAYVMTHLSQIVLIDGLLVAISEDCYMGAEFEPETSYSLCKFKGGTISTEDDFIVGESIEKSEFDNYAKRGKVLDSFNYDKKSVEELYAEMYIWK